MKLAIMQPYFFPYIGYFQLIKAVDRFVLYDNIKYTKKGWINRNRILRQSEEAVFTLPLKHASDSLLVQQRELAADFDGNKLANQVREAYRRAPYFESAFPVIEQALRCSERNLFGYLQKSLSMVCAYLKIETDIVSSSSLDIDHALKSQDKVIALCQAAQAEMYINAIGGVSLYARDAFKAAGIELRFIKSSPMTYDQFGGEFVPWLSIIDVMMFNTVDDIGRYLASGYELIEGQ